MPAPRRSLSAAALPDVYYVAHCDNIPSIMEHGVLSRRAAVSAPHKSIYDNAAAANHRKSGKTPDGRGLWEFASLYFNPRNPMLYRAHACDGHDVAVIKMKKSAHWLAEYVAIGDAASADAQILPHAQGLRALQSPDVKKRLFAQSWGKDGESKRVIMAEMLAPEKIPPEHIDVVYVPDNDRRKALAKRISARIVPEPKMFFRNGRTRQLEGTSISLVDGDMFFSPKQTLVIPVNTVGVMGGGLAAQAKANFPHVYGEYQELCRGKKLTTKTPFLLGESLPYDEILASDPETLQNKPNGEKWLLLFATKEHWSAPSTVDYIEGGMRWLAKNAVKEGVSSLALPALGCGLGALPWDVVGPIMCQWLAKLGLPCEIYLPRERADLPDEQLSAEFLLSA